MSDNAFGAIIQTEHCLVSEEIVTEYFACDYDRCHGACCVVGDSGAPLLEEETEWIERDYKAFYPFMTEQGRRAAEAAGFFELDREGDLVTPTVKEAHKVGGLDFIPGAMDGLVGTSGLEDCAYIHYEALKNGGVACLCSIEKCHEAGDCAFRKPISCSLYPIRVTRLRSGQDALNLHRWSICRPAFEKGRREGIRVYQFLCKPLIARYGAGLIEALDAAADYLTSK